MAAEPSATDDPDSDTQPPLPVMHALESAALDAAGFDTTHNVLFVTFRDSGDTYLYYQVPRELFTRLLSSPSKGDFFLKYVRGHFPFEKRR